LRFFLILTFQGTRVRIINSPSHCEGRKSTESLGEEGKENKVLTNRGGMLREATESCITLSYKIFNRHKVVSDGIQCGAVAFRVKCVMKIIDTPTIAVWDSEGRGRGGRMKYKWENVTTLSSSAVGGKMAIA
jgi:hypothetical protein